MYTNPYRKSTENHYQTLEITKYLKSSNLGPLDLSFLEMTETIGINSTESSLSAFLTAP